MNVSQPFDGLTAVEILQGLPSRLHQAYEPHVAATPEATALIEGDVIWTYRQFADAVDAVAADFLGRGVRPGDRIMLVSENSVAVAASVFAASKLNAWPIVANPRLSPREIDLIFAHSGARLQVFMTGVSPEAAAHAERRGALLQPIGPFQYLAVSALNSEAVPEPVNPTVPNRLPR